MAHILVAIDILGLMITNGLELIIEANLHLSSMRFKLGRALRTKDELWEVMQIDSSFPLANSTGPGERACLSPQSRVNTGQPSALSPGRDGQPETKRWSQKSQAAGGRAASAHRISGWLQSTVRNSLLRWPSTHPKPEFISLSSSVSSFPG